VTPFWLLFDESIDVGAAGRRHDQAELVSALPDATELTCGALIRSTTQALSRSRTSSMS
jgi:hypothetical protein